MTALYDAAAGVRIGSSSSIRFPNGSDTYARLNPASGSSEAVSAICTQAIYLEQGHVVAQGGVREVIDRYVDHVKAPARTSVRDRADRQGDGRIRVTDIVVGNGHSVATGEDIEIEVHYEAREPLQAAVRIDIAVYGALAEAVFQCSNEVSGDRIGHLAERGVFLLTIKRMPLAPGHYTLNVYSEVDGVVADWVQSAAFMEVLEGDYFGTGRMPSHKAGVWNVMRQAGVVSGGVPDSTIERREN